MMRALIIASLLAATAPAHAATVWSDEFTTGAPDPALWHDCAGPWLNRVEQCSHLQAGPGEQVYWNRTLFGAEDGAATVLPVRGAGQIIQFATRLTARERASIAAASARQGVTTAVPAKVAFANALASAAWKSSWLETSRQVLPGQTLTVAFSPGYDPSYWGGPWGYDHVSGHPYFEVDLAETTFIDSKTMIVRQSVHAGGPSNTISCGSTMKPGWIYPSVKIATDGMSITFGMNGKTVCTKPLPFKATGYNVILSQQVGGLAKATTAATGPMKSQYDFVRTTTP